MEQPPALGAKRHSEHPTEQSSKRRRLEAESVHLTLQDEQHSSDGSNDASEKKEKNTEQPQYTQGLSQLFDPSKPALRSQRWEKRWVFVPNIFQYGKDIWVKRYISTHDISEI